MPLDNSSTGNEAIYGEAVQDIIEEIPSWIFKMGVSLFFIIFLSVIGLAALIRYPDIVNASIKIDSPDSPKPIVSKISGKPIKLLKKENSQVKSGESLAFIESTADHMAIISLLAQLRNMQELMKTDRPIADVAFKRINTEKLGELQSYYQTFIIEYLTYSSTLQNGFLIRKKILLQKDQLDIDKQQVQLKNQQIVQQKDLELSEEDYRMHQKLLNAKVETVAEFRQQESKYLAKKGPLIQTEAALITASLNYTAKQKEMLELNNQLIEEKLRFSMA